MTTRRDPMKDLILTISYRIQRASRDWSRGKEWSTLAYSCEIERCDLDRIEKSKLYYAYGLENPITMTLHMD